MSGAYSASHLLSLCNKEKKSANELTILKDVGLYTSSNLPNKENVIKLRELNITNPNDIVFLSAEGKIVLGTTTQVGSSSQVPTITARTVYNKTLVEKSELQGLIEGKSLNLNLENIKKVLEEYIKTLPKSGETYLPGEVKIYMFKDIDISVSSLLAAGSKVLDSILYCCYHESDEHNFIFDVEKMDHEVNKLEIAENINYGQKAIKAAFTTVYNQGYLPSLGQLNRGMSRFVKETIFGDNNLTELMFCERLSSTNPSKFPASVFLQISIDSLPTEVASRCKMSIAGNRAIRYAVLAKSFERRDPDAEDIGGSVGRAINRKISSACDIVDCLSSLSSDWEAQKRMHPLNSQKVVLKNFTLQLTHAIIYSLTAKGRQDLHDTIIDKKIEAFKRDTNFFGVMNNENELIFPILDNTDADFLSLSITNIKAAYGK
nr:TPA_asm: coat protein [Phalaenopsis ophiovirus]